MAYIKNCHVSFRSDDVNFYEKKSVTVVAEGICSTINELLEAPGRYIRPPKIVIILRGLPGSGKTQFAKNVRTRENNFGADAPRILDLDAYFEADGEVTDIFIASEIHRLAEYIGHVGKNLQ